MFTTKNEIEDWLEEKGIELYSIREDMTVDVHEDVNLDGSDLDTEEKIDELPVKFGKIKGYFDISSNLLENLKNCPNEVHGNFNAVNNYLVSLEGAPDYIEGYFDITEDYHYEREDKLQNFKGISINMVVLGEIYCDFCRPDKSKEMFAEHQHKLEHDNLQGLQEPLPKKDRHRLS